MLAVAELIRDLTEATSQLKQAAMADDWTMVDKLQKRRVVLIEQIAEQARTLPLTEDEAQAMSAVRKEEATVAARASARHQTLGKALEELQTGSRAETKNRMQKAYGAVDPKG
jgi:hypothetical protein